MKVLLVHPKTYYRRGIPLGLAYIAAVLREDGHNVRVYDPAPYDKTTLEEALRKFQPDVAGFTCTTPTTPKALEMAATVKNYSDIPVIFGGVHPTSDPHGTLGYKEVDYIIMGEGEETAKELVDAIEGKKPLDGVKGIGYNNGAKKKINEPRPLIKDLDSLPLPARDLFPMRWYTQRSTQIRGCWYSQTGLFTSRGCPSDCIFCASKIMFKRMFRPRSPEKVVDEVEHLLGKYKLEALTFDDDSFAVNRHRAIDICKEIRKRGLDFVWHAQMRTDTTHEDVVKEMVKSGCIQVSFGVESGSPRVLEAMHKGNTPQDAVNAFRICKRHGLKTLANFMLGNPEETEEDIEMTRQLAHKLDADYTGFYITIPYPGTELYRMATENGWLIPGKTLGDFVQGMSGRCPVMRINFDPEELVRIHNRIESEFLSDDIKNYMRNTKFLKDMAVFLACRPQALIKSFAKYIKTMRLNSFVAELENQQRRRRFP